MQDPRETIRQARSVNPMAQYSAYKGGNPLVDVVVRKSRREAAEQRRQAPRRALRTVSDAMQQFTGFRPFSRREQEQKPVYRPPVPLTEAEVNRREQMREEYNQTLNQMREDIKSRYSEDQIAEGRAAIAQRQEDMGSFLKRAYASYRDREGDEAVDPFEAVMMRDRYNLVNPALSERFSPVARRRVAKEFQRTHKWARDRKNLDMLDVAVDYLMSRPDYQQSRYYNP
ncbi:MAG: hypothetical protein VW438_00045 [Euryarchaeota archaeon]|jgi:hypothetical protein